MVQAVRLFDVIRQLREARILVVSDHKQPQGDGDRIQPLETMIVRLGSDRLNEYYNATDEQAVRQEMWMTTRVAKQNWRPR